MAKLFLSTTVSQRVKGNNIFLLGAQETPTAPDSKGKKKDKTQELYSELETSRLQLIPVESGP